MCGFSNLPVISDEQDWVFFAKSQPRETGFGHNLLLTQRLCCILLEVKYPGQAILGDGREYGGQRWRPGHISHRTAQVEGHYCLRQFLTCFATLLSGLYRVSGIPRRYLNSEDRLLIQIWVTEFDENYCLFSPSTPQI
jgi:hypothetical protein